VDAIRPATDVSRPLARILVKQEVERHYGRSGPVSCLRVIQE